jgi:hypothetical protein
VSLQRCRGQPDRLRYQVGLPAVNATLWTICIAVHAEPCRSTRVYGWEVVRTKRCGTKVLLVDLVFMAAQGLVNKAMPRPSGQSRRRAQLKRVGGNKLLSEIAGDVHRVPKTFCNVSGFH